MLRSDLMSVISNFGKKFSGKTKEISQKAKIMSETNSLKGIIKGEEGKIDFQYKNIGKLYFEKYGSNPDEEFKEAIEIINASNKKIQETKEEIIKVKSQFCCVNCGKQFKSDDVFCSKCGTKIPRETEKPTTKECPTCENVLPIGANFCNVCRYEFNAASEEATNETTETTEAVETTAAITEAAVEPDKAVTEVLEKTEESKQNETKPEEIIEKTDTSTDKEAEKATGEKKVCPNPNCKNEIDENEKFCNKCGTKIQQ